MTWPNDPRRHYALYIEEIPGGTGIRAFVVIQNIRTAGGSGRSAFFRNEDNPQGEWDRDDRDRVISRLGTRLDLSEVFYSRNVARDAGYEAARRFAVGQLSPERVEIKKKVKDYQLIGGAGFRSDVMRWEPTLTVKRKREASKGGALTQTFDEINSPFRFNTFPTAASAAGFGLDYGEKMVLGMVAGLQI